MKLSKGDVPVGPVISDSSPLIALSAIDRFDILRALYARILIPPAVWDEVVTSGEERPGVRQVQAADWIMRAELEEPERARTLLLETPFGPGEIEVICLAEELDGATILLDDKRARAFAEERGIDAHGTLRVLVLATKQGFLKDLAGAIDDLRAARFRVSNAARTKALRLAHR